MIIMYRKITAVFTTLCFLFAFVLAPALQAAVEITAGQKQFRQIIDDFVLPHSTGRITSGNFYAADRVVVNIQDLHCHPEVQRNISRILELLDQKYRVNHVFVEGAAGAVDTAWLSGIKDAGLKKEIVETMVDQGKLTGAEYYSISSGKPGLLSGLEDDGLYRSNLIRLKTILERKPVYDQSLAMMRSELEGLKTRYFGSKNAKLEKVVRKYRSGDIDGDRFYRQLLKHAETLNDAAYANGNIAGIDLASYRHISAYLELARDGRAIKYRAVSRQLQGFVGVLKQKLPYAAYNTLLEKTDHFSRMDELTVYLARLAREYDLALDAEYPDLNAFFAYIEKSQSINPIELLREEKRLIEEVRTGLSRDVTELEVSFLADFFSYFEDFLYNRLSSDDYAYFAGHFGQFRAIWAKQAGSAGIDRLENDIDLLTAYYQVNLQRNQSFLKNLMAVQREGSARQECPAAPAGSDISRVVAALDEGAEVTVVITGGFHTDGLERLLDEQRISHIAVTPNVTLDTRTSDMVYRELARQQARILSASLAPMLVSLMASRAATAADDPAAAPTRGLILKELLEVASRHAKDPGVLAGRARQLVSSIDFLDGFEAEATQDQRTRQWRLVLHKGQEAHVFEIGKDGSVRYAGEPAAAGRTGDNPAPGMMSAVARAAAFSADAAFASLGNALNALLADIIAPLETLDLFLALAGEQNGYVDECAGLAGDLAGMQLVAIADGSVHFNPLLLSRLERTAQRALLSHGFAVRDFRSLCAADQRIAALAAAAPWVESLYVSFLSSSADRDLSLPDGSAPSRHINGSGDARVRAAAPIDDAFGVTLRYEDPSETLRSWNDVRSKLKAHAADGTARAALEKKRRDLERIKEKRADLDAETLRRVENTLEDTLTQISVLDSLASPAELDQNNSAAHFAGVFKLLKQTAAILPAVEAGLSPASEIVVRFAPYYLADPRALASAGVEDGTLVVTLYNAAARLDDHDVVRLLIHETSHLWARSMSAAERAALYAVLKRFLDAGKGRAYGYSDHNLSSEGELFAALNERLRTSGLTLVRTAFESGDAPYRAAVLAVLKQNIVLVNDDMGIRRLRTGGGGRPFNLHSDVTARILPVLDAMDESLRSGGNADAQWEQLLAIFVQDGPPAGPGGLKGRDAGRDGRTFASVLGAAYARVAVVWEAVYSYPFISSFSRFIMRLFDPRQAASLQAGRSGFVAFLETAGRLVSSSLFAAALLSGNAVALIAVTFLWAAVSDIVFVADHSPRLVVDGRRDWKRTAGIAAVGAVLPLVSLAPFILQHIGITLPWGLNGSMSAALFSGLAANVSIHAIFNRLAFSPFGRRAGLVPASVPVQDDDIRTPAEKIAARFADLKVNIPRKVIAAQRALYTIGSSRANIVDEVADVLAEHRLERDEMAASWRALIAAAQDDKALVSLLSGELLRRVRDALPSRLDGVVVDTLAEAVDDNVVLDSVFIHLYRTARELEGAEQARIFTALSELIERKGSFTLTDEIVTMLLNDLADVFAEPAWIFSDELPPALDREQRSKLFRPSADGRRFYFRTGFEDEMVWVRDVDTKGQLTDIHREQEDARLVFALLLLSVAGYDDGSIVREIFRRVEDGSVTDHAAASMVYCLVDTDEWGTMWPDGRTLNDEEFRRLDIILDLYARINDPDKEFDLEEVIGSIPTASLSDAALGRIAETVSRKMNLDPFFPRTSTNGERQHHNESVRARMMILVSIAERAMRQDTPFAQEYLRLVMVPALNNANGWGDEAVSALMTGLASLLPAAARGDFTRVNREALLGMIFYVSDADTSLFSPLLRRPTYTTLFTVLDSCRSGVIDHRRAYIALDMMKDRRGLLERVIADEAVDTHFRIYALNLLSDQPESYESGKQLAVLARSLVEPATRLIREKLADQGDWFSTMLTSVWERDTDLEVYLSAVYLSMIPILPAAGDRAHYQMISEARKAHFLSTWNSADSNYAIGLPRVKESPLEFFSVLAHETAHDFLSMVGGVFSAGMNRKVFHEYFAELASLAFCERFGIDTKTQMERDGYPDVYKEVSAAGHISVQCHDPALSVLYMIDASYRADQGRAPPWGELIALSWEPRSDIMLSNPPFNVVIERILSTFARANGNAVAADAAEPHAETPASGLEISIPTMETIAGILGFKGLFTGKAAQWFAVLWEQVFAFPFVAMFVKPIVAAFNPVMAGRMGTTRAARVSVAAGSAAAAVALTAGIPALTIAVAGLWAVVSGYQFAVAHKGPRASDRLRAWRAKDFLLLGVGAVLSLAAVLPSALFFAGLPVPFLAGFAPFQALPGIAVFGLHVPHVILTIAEGMGFNALIHALYNAAARTPLGRRIGLVPASVFNQLDEEAFNEIIERLVSRHFQDAALQAKGGKGPLQLAEVRRWMEGFKEQYRLLLPSAVSLARSRATADIRRELERRSRAGLASDGSALRLELALAIAERDNQRADINVVKAELFADVQMLVEEYPVFDFNAIRSAVYAKYARSPYLNYVSAYLEQYIRSVELFILKREISPFRLSFDPLIDESIHNRVICALNQKINGKPYLAAVMKRLYPADEYLRGRDWTVPNGATLTVTPAVGGTLVQDDIYEGADLLLTCTFDGHTYYVDLFALGMADRDEMEQTPELNMLFDPLYAASSLPLFAGLVGHVTRGVNRGKFAGICALIPEKGAYRQMRDVLSDPRITLAEKQRWVRRMVADIVTMTAPAGTSFRRVDFNIDWFRLRQVAGTGIIDIRPGRIAAAPCSSGEWLECLLGFAAGVQYEGGIPEDYFTEGWVLDGIVDAWGVERARELLQAQVADDAGILRGPGQERNYASILHYLGKNDAAREVLRAARERYAVFGMDFPIDWDVEDIFRCRDVGEHTLAKRGPAPLTRSGTYRFTERLLARVPSAIKHAFFRTASVGRTAETVVAPFIALWDLPLHIVDMLRGRSPADGRRAGGAAAIVGITAAAGVVLAALHAPFLAAAAGMYAAYAGAHLLYNLIFGAGKDAAPLTRGMDADPGEIDAYIDEHAEIAQAYLSLKGELCRGGTITEAGLKRDLVALHKAALMNAPYLFKEGIPAVQTAFDGELEKFWPGMVVMGLAQGMNSIVLFRNSLPSLHALFGDDLETHWADLVMIGQNIGEGALDIFNAGFAEAKELFGDDFETYWPGMVALAMIAGDRSFGLFKKGLPALKKVFGNDLKKYWPDIVDLASHSDTDTICRLLIEGIPALHAIYGEEFLSLWSDLLSLGMSAGVNAGSLYSQGIPAMKEMVVGRENLVRVGGQLVLLGKAAGSQAGSLYSGLHTLRKIFGDGFTAHWDGIYALGISAAPNADRMILNGIPAVKKYFGGDFEYYWPGLQKIGGTAGEYSYALFTEGVSATMEMFRQDPRGYWPVVVNLAHAAGNNAFGLCRHGIPELISLIGTKEDLAATGAVLIDLGRDAGDNALFFYRFGIPAVCGRITTNDDLKKYGTAVAPMGAAAEHLPALQSLIRTPEEITDVGGRFASWSNDTRNACLKFHASGVAAGKDDFIRLGTAVNTFLDARNEKLKEQQLALVSALDHYPVEIVEYILRTCAAVKRNRKLWYIRNLNAVLSAQGMTPQDSLDDWQVFLEYQIGTELGFTPARDIVEAYRSLLRSEPLDGPVLGRYSLREIGVTSTGKEGVRQFIGAVRAADLFVSKDISSADLTNRVKCVLIGNMFGFYTGQWSHGLYLKRDFRDFVEQWKSHPAPEADPRIAFGRETSFFVDRLDAVEFDAKEVARFQWLKGIAAHAVGKLSEPEKALPEYRARLLQVLAQVGADPARIERAAARRSSVRALTIAMTREFGADVIAERRNRRANAPAAAPSDIVKWETLADTIVEMIVWEACRQHAGIKEKLTAMTRDGLNVAFVDWVHEFKRDMLKDHLLGDLSVDEQRNVLELIDIDIFAKTKSKVQGTRSSGRTAVTAFFNKGILGELAGDVGDACYTNESDIMHYPSMEGAVLFTSGEGRERKFVGSMLVLTNTIDGKEVWVARALNPTDDFLSEHSAESFLGGALTFLRDAADAAGVERIVLPHGTFGVLSNRSRIDDAGKGYIRGQGVVLDGEDYFNGAPLRKGCFDLNAEQLPQRSAALTRAATYRIGERFFASVPGQALMSLMWVFNKSLTVERATELIVAPWIAVWDLPFHVFDMLSGAETAYAPRIAGAVTIPVLAAIAGIAAAALHAPALAVIMSAYAVYGIAHTVFNTIFGGNAPSLRPINRAFAEIVLGKNLSTYRDGLIKLQNACGDGIFVKGLAEARELYGDRFDDYWPYLCELGVAAGEHAPEVFQYGLPALSHLITGPDRMRAAVRTLIELHRASGDDLWSVCRYGFPLVPSQFTDIPQLRITSQEMVALWKASGKEARYCFDSSLPVVQKTFGDRFDSLWPTLAKSLLMSGKDAWSVARFGLPAAAGAVHDAESLKSVIEELLVLRLIFGKDETDVFLYGLPAMASLIRSEKDLNEAVRILGNLRSMAGANGRILYQHALPSVVASLGSGASMSDLAAQVDEMQQALTAAAARSAGLNASEKEFVARITFDYVHFGVPLEDIAASVNYDHARFTDTRSLLGQALGIDAGEAIEEIYLRNGAVTPEDLRALYPCRETAIGTAVPLRFAAGYLALRLNAVDLALERSLSSTTEAKIGEEFETRWDAVPFGWTVLHQMSGMDITKHLVEFQTKPYRHSGIVHKLQRGMGGTEVSVHRVVEQVVSEEDFRLIELIGYLYGLGAFSARPALGSEIQYDNDERTSHTRKSVWDYLPRSVAGPLKFMHSSEWNTATPPDLYKMLIDLAAARPQQWQDLKAEIQAIFKQYPNDNITMKEVRTFLSMNYQLFFDEDQYSSDVMEQIVQYAESPSSTRAFQLQKAGSYGDEAFAREYRDGRLAKVTVTDPGLLSTIRKFQIGRDVLRIIVEEKTEDSAAILAEIRPLCTPSEFAWLSEHIDALLDAIVALRYIDVTRGDIDIPWKTGGAGIRLYEFNAYKHLRELVGTGNGSALTSVMEAAAQQAGDALVGDPALRRVYRAGIVRSLRAACMRGDISEMMDDAVFRDNVDRSVAQIMRVDAAAQGAGGRLTRVATKEAIDRFFAALGIGNPPRLAYETAVAVYELPSLARLAAGALLGGRLNGGAAWQAMDQWLDQHNDTSESLRSRRRAATLTVIRATAAAAVAGCGLIAAAIVIPAIQYIVPAVVSALVLTAAVNVGMHVRHNISVSREPFLDGPVQTLTYEGAAAACDIYVGQREAAVETAGDAPVLATSGIRTCVALALCLPGRAGAMAHFDVGTDVAASVGRIVRALRRHGISRNDLAQMEVSLVGGWQNTVPGLTPYSEKLISDIIDALRGRGITRQPRMDVLYGGSKSMALDSRTGAIMEYRGSDGLPSPARSEKGDACVMVGSADADGLMTRMLRRLRITVAAPDAGAPRAARMEPISIPAEDREEYYPRIIELNKTVGWDEFRIKSGVHRALNSTGSECWVVRGTNGAIAGYAIAETSMPRTLYLSYMAVDASAQNSGFAVDLFGAFYESARSQGKKFVQLDCDNELIGFYSRLIRRFNSRDEIETADAGKNRTTMRVPVSDDFTSTDERDEPSRVMALCFKLLKPLQAVGLLGRFAAGKDRWKELKSMSVISIVENPDAEIGTARRLAELGVPALAMAPLGAAAGSEGLAPFVVRLAGVETELMYDARARMLYLPFKGRDFASAAGEISRMINDSHRLRADLGLAAGRGAIITVGSPALYRELSRAGLVPGSSYVVNGSADDMNWSEGKKVDLFQPGLFEKPAAYLMSLFDNVARRAHRIRLIKGQDLTLTLSWKFLSAALASDESRRLFAGVAGRMQAGNIRIIDVPQNLPGETWQRMLAQLRADGLKVLGRVVVRDALDQALAERVLSQIAADPSSADARYGGMEIDMSGILSTVSEVAAWLNDIARQRPQARLTVVLPRFVRADELQPLLHDGIAIAADSASLGTGTGKCLKVTVEKGFDLVRLIEQVKNGDADMVEIVMRTDVLNAETIGRLADAVRDIINNPRSVYETALQADSIPGIRVYRDRIRSFLSGYGISLSAGDFRAAAASLGERTGPFLSDAAAAAKALRRGPSAGQLGSDMEELLADQGTTPAARQECAARILALLKGTGETILVRHHLETHDMKGFDSDNDRIAFGRSIWAMDEAAAAYADKTPEAVAAACGTDAARWTAAIRSLRAAGNTAAAERLLVLMRETVLSHPELATSYLLAAELDHPDAQIIALVPAAGSTSVAKIRRYLVAGEYADEIGELLKQVQPAALNDQEDLTVCARACVRYGALSYEDTRSLLNAIKDRLAAISDAKEPLSVAGMFEVLELLANERLKIDRSSKTKLLDLRAMTALLGAA